MRDVLFWFPPLDDAALSVSFVTYAGQLYMTVAADRAVLPDPDFVTTTFVAEVIQSNPMRCNGRRKSSPPASSTELLRLCVSVCLSS